MVAHSSINHAGITGVGGAQLDYVQITSSVSIAATTEATSNTIITGTSQAYAAVATLIQVFTTRIDLGAHASGNVCHVLLYDGATLIGRIGTIAYPANGAFITPLSLSYRLTPTAATHQYIVKGIRTNANCAWEAGSGGAATALPSFLRITRA